MTYFLCNINTVVSSKVPVLCLYLDCDITVDAVDYIEVGDSTARYLNNDSYFFHPL